MQLMRLNLLEAHQMMEGFAWSPTLPTFYSLVADSANPTRWNLWMPTQQTQGSVLKYLYVSRKPTYSLVRENRGKVTVASGVATFTTAVVNDLWEGAVLRISKDGVTAPTGEYGDVPVNDLTYNRDCYEVRVLKVLSTTTCQLSDVTISAASVTYTASSLIDVADGAMTVLLQRLCEDEYGAKMVGNHTERLVSHSMTLRWLTPATFETKVWRLNGSVSV